MPTIVDVAVQAGTFKTLVAAVQAAGLVDTLNGQGPFTVFAPTDEAFAKLPKGTVDTLLKDIPKLKNILLYHVVAGKIMAEDATNLTSAKTVQGQDIRIDASSKEELGKDEAAFARDSVHWHRYLLLNNSSYVIKANVKADNGVIHVINTVLLPK
jgi:uncharacterized surface protein with fasciclin (FAS1) repeats